MSVLKSGSDLLRNTAGILVQHAITWRDTGITDWRDIDPNGIYHDAFGVLYDFDSVLVSVARRGLIHVGSGTNGWGNITQWSMFNSSFTRSTLYTATGYDNRNLGGGKVPSTGTGLAWFARYHYSDATWADMICLRTIDQGSNWSTITTIDPGDEGFSPYGPLVQLPSGKILASFYGGAAAGPHKVWLLPSTDDGLTWGSAIYIINTSDYFPTETAAVYLDGSTDATTRLIAISRNNSGKMHQHTSSDGGENWTDIGELSFTPAGADSSGAPHLRLFNGSVYLTYDDQVSKQIKITSATPNNAYAGTWGAVTTLKSCSAGGDFGYSNLVPYGDNLLAMCYDTPTDSNADLYLGLVEV